MKKVECPFCKREIPLRALSMKKSVVAWDAFIIGAIFTLMGIVGAIFWWVGDESPTYTAFSATFIIFTFSGILLLGKSFEPRVICGVGIGQGMALLFGGFLLMDMVGRINLGIRKESLEWTIVTGITYLSLAAVFLVLGFYRPKRISAEDAGGTQPTDSSEDKAHDERSPQ